MNIWNTIIIDNRLLKMLTLIAALFILLPLPVMQYIGEEGLNAIRSYEAYLSGNYLHSGFYGLVMPQAPLFNLPVILIASTIGWEHLDIAIRMVSVMASWGSAFAAFMLARHLFPDREQAPWLASLIYLSMGEVSFWYGWLGYVDALFGCFIFSAMACLWIALDKCSITLLAIAIALISVAYLVKNFTALILLAIAGLVLTVRLQRWSFVLSAKSIFILLCIFLTPWVFTNFVVQSESALTTTYANAMHNFIGYSFFDYLGHWLSYPFLFIARSMPVSLLLIYLWLRRSATFSMNKTLTTLTLVLISCFSPFWISAGASPRYLVPLYGLVALLLTGLLLQLDSGRLRQGVMLIALLLVLKIPYSLLALPYIKDWRPERDVKQVAREIIQMTDDAPLMTENDVSTGLAIAAYIDVWRQDRPPVRWNNRKVRAYVLAKVATPRLGKLIKSWRLRGDHVYLYLQSGT